jgi:hypothetical protein
MSDDRESRQIAANGSGCFHPRVVASIIYRMVVHLLFGDPANIEPQKSWSVTQGKPSTPPPTQREKAETKQRPKQPPPQSDKK